MHHHYTHTGIKRLFYATRYSVQGFRFGWQEEAFRQEVYCCMPLAILSVFLNVTTAEHLILLTSLVIVLITELLNSAVEAVVDRISDEWHQLSGSAKDLGSAAVLLSIIFAMIVWLVILL